jgi:hypothetical protein
MSFLLFFFLALKAPILLLAVGPVVYGVPHLWASFRYTLRGGVLHKDTSDFGREFLIPAIITVVVFASLRGFFPWKIEIPTLGQTGIYGFAVVVSFVVVGIVALSHGGIRTFRSGVVFTTGFLGLLTLLYVDLWKTAGALILAHHFVAFFAWIRIAPTGRDRAVALGALVVFTLIHIAVCAGLFDVFKESLWHHPIQPELGMTMDREGRGILGPLDRSVSKLWYFRAVVCYAFGQAVHYVVWLKIIPEASYRLKIPTSFTQSWRLLKKDVGTIVATVAVLAGVGFFAFWVLSEYAPVRHMYLSLAFFHGFFEISSLFVIRGRV